MPPPTPGKLRVIEEHENDSYMTRNFPLRGTHSEIPLELEVDVLRREREILLQRIGELEQDQGKEEKPAEQAESSGIIHSVHIRTGGGAISSSGSSACLSPTATVSDLIRTKFNHSTSDLSGRHPKARLRPGHVPKSASQGDLVAAGEGGQKEDGAGVNIEIKNHSHHLAKQLQKKLQNPSVSVVNLSNSNRSGSPADPRGRTSSFGTPQYPPQRMATKSSMLLPGRVGPRKTHNREKYYFLNPYQSKSKSVENLHGGMAVLGLKAANSEMALARSQGQVGSARSQRLKGTSSELNVSKIGVTEKMRLNPIVGLDGIVSMPAELSGNQPKPGVMGRSGSVPIKPNREKIRAVLGMSNVIELQRQLLTTVMENEASDLVFLSNAFADAINQHGNFHFLNY